MAKNKGRQKIELRKIQNENNLQVTFSKRRFSIFKKASELCTLCGVEILMIVFSPGGKVFSFGHPNVRDLIERNLNRNHNSFQRHNNNLQLVELHCRIQHLNDIFTQVLLEQEKIKEQTEILNQIKECREKTGLKWYEKDVKELDLNQTNHLIYALEGMKSKLLSENISQNSQANVPQKNYLGESPGLIGGRNVDVGIDFSDQKSNTIMNNNPNMVLPNYGPSFGYNNREVIDPRSNMKYMPSHNFNLKL